jgi:putative tryptophan/tyrosine transport system substrate-binding protein
LRVAHAAGILLALAAALAQAQTGPRTLAYIGFQGEPAEGSPMRAVFVDRLRALGHAPGSLKIEVWRWTNDSELRAAVSEALRAKPDVIFVGPPSAALAVRQASREIPIVCGSCGDPVQNGLAASLARPGGNVTGLASLSAELIGKRLAILKEVLPGVSRVAVFIYPDNPGTKSTLKELEAATKALRLNMQRFEIRGARDFEAAFGSAAAGGAGAVVLQDDPLNRAAANQIADLALKHRLPLSSGIVEVADAGALISYGPDRADLVRRASGVADKVLKGAKPGNLPFEQAVKFELVLNLRTAKMIGVAVPPAVLVRADRVIE